MQIHKSVRMKHYLTIFCQHPQWWFIGNISIKIFFNKKLQKNARKSNPLYKRIVGVLVLWPDSACEMYISASKIFTIFDVFPVNLKSFQIHLSQLTKAIWMNEWCLLKCQIWLMATDEVYVCGFRLWVSIMSIGFMLYLLKRDCLRLKLQKAIPNFIELPCYYEQKFVL